MTGRRSRSPPVDRPRRTRCLDPRPGSLPHSMSTLGLVGAPNARDLGGLVTVDGRRLRRGALLRASALGRLSDQDVAALGKLDLSLVIDLRDPSEIRVAPPDRLPEPAAGRCSSIAAPARTVPAG